MGILPNVQQLEKRRPVKKSRVVVVYVGGAKDIGSSLTRLCFRQRSIENQLKTFTKFVLAMHVYFMFILFTSVVIDSVVLSLIMLKFLMKLLINVFCEV